jgi:heme/copper-type cytochrome/quinol oxidase subunit 2
MKALKIVLPLVAIALLVMLATNAQAQCAMCAAVTESSKAEGSTQANGINNGIMYIFTMPYLIIGTIVFFWLRARRKAKVQGPIL